ncbi:hypothetical protein [Candidatus Methanomassiliicoccus intestinalis]|uniref:hypothetical protein n=1 Tax=Candidatus Methanomassiliicoccus intestinalis TaxID=1406512 RepID=UPI0037DC3626
MKIVTRIYARGKGALAFQRAAFASASQFGDVLTKLSTAADQDRELSSSEGAIFSGKSRGQLRVVSKSMKNRENLSNSTAFAP